MYKKNAFTLIEVIVVVSIFLLTIIALTPFVRMARERANKINCVNNLRRISLALHMYAADHDNAFPPKLGALYPNYAKDEKIFDCPASRTRGTPDNPDYNYIEGLTETSPQSELIVYDLDNNHIDHSRNVLRINGYVGGVSKGKGRPR